MPLSEAALANRIDAVDWDINDPVRQWHTSDEPALQWTYRFEAIEADDFPWTDVSGLSAYTQPQRETIRSALARYEEVVNVQFTEVTDTSLDPDFSFYRAAEGLFGGRGRFDYRYWFDGPGGTVGTQLWDGSAVFNTREALDDNDMYLVLHEIGHMFGLKHTGDYDVGGNNPPGPFLPTDEDNTRYSVMSYSADPITNETIPALGIYDVAALQARFGANMSHATGDDVYQGPEDIGVGRIEVVWDAGGIDWFDATEESRPTHIDLRQGHFSDMADAGELIIAYGSEIERAVGGTASDKLIGNNLDNILVGIGGRDTLNGRSGEDGLYGGAGADRLFGGAGADKLFGANGDDILKGGRGADKIWGARDDDTLTGGLGADRLRDGSGDDIVFGGGGRDRIHNGNGEDNFYGGAGYDIFYAGGPRADFTFTQSGNEFTLARGNTTDTGQGFERIVFTDDDFLL